MMESHDLGLAPTIPQNLVMSTEFGHCYNAFRRAFQHGNVLKVTSKRLLKEAASFARTWYSSYRAFSWPGENPLDKHFPDQEDITRFFVHKPRKEDWPSHPFAERYIFFTTTEYLVAFDFAIVTKNKCALVYTTETSIILTR